MKHPTVYKFKTFQEAVDNLPSDKIIECFEELGKTLAAAKMSVELAFLVATGLSENDGNAPAEMPGRIIELPEELEWIDDGEGTCEAHIKDYCTIKISKHE